MGGEEPTKGEHMEEDMGGKMMEANITFLMVALGSFVHTALRMFRYRSDADYYIYGALITNKITNYWEMLNMAGGYWMLVLSGILTITQILSMVGVAAEINVMAWMYLGLADTVIGLILSLIGMYAYDVYYSVTADAAADAND